MSDTDQLRSTVKSAMRIGETTSWMRRDTPFLVVALSSVGKITAGGVRIKSTVLLQRYPPQTAASYCRHPSEPTTAGLEISLKRARISNFYFLFNFPNVKITWVLEPQKWRYVSIFVLYLQFDRTGEWRDGGAQTRRDSGSTHQSPPAHARPNDPRTGVKYSRKLPPAEPGRMKSRRMPFWFRPVIPSRKEVLPHQ